MVPNLYNRLCKQQKHDAALTIAELYTPELTSLGQDCLSAVAALRLSALILHIEEPKISSSHSRNCLLTYKGTKDMTYLRQSREEKRF